MKMKSSIPLILLAALALGVQAQTKPATEVPAPILVVSCSWVRAERSQGSSGDREKKARDAAIDQQIALETRENDPRNQKTAEEVKRLEQSKNTLALIPLPAGVVKGYEYRAEVKNTSDKTIKRIEWSYVFTDPLTHQQLTRHELFSRVQIHPGREKKVAVFARVSPPNVIDAKELSKNANKPWDESVLINGVEFADGSLWRPAPSQSNSSNHQ